MSTYSLQEYCKKLIFDDSYIKDLIVIADSCNVIRKIAIGDEDLQKKLVDRINETIDNKEEHKSLINSSTVIKYTTAIEKYFINEYFNLYNDPKVNGAIDHLHIKTHIMADKVMKTLFMQFRQGIFNHNFDDVKKILNTIRICNEGKCECKDKILGCYASDVMINYNRKKTAKTVQNTIVKPLVKAMTGYIKGYEKLVKENASGQ